MELIGIMNEAVLLLLMLSVAVTGGAILLVSALILLAEAIGWLRGGRSDG